MFDDLTDVYEAMIDWPKRLANEGPFYRRLVRALRRAQRVDAACGTGRHAAMFHSWGIRVEGADISPRDDRPWRSNFGEPAGLRWVVRSFDQPIASARAVRCGRLRGQFVGPGPDKATVERAIGQMTAGVRSGGLIVVHVLNLWRLPDGPCVWQKCRRTTLSQGEVLIAKGVHRSGGRGFVELLVSRLTEPVAMQSESLPLVALDAAELEAMARGAAPAKSSSSAGIKIRPAIAAKSVDLVMVAEKQ